MSMFSTVLCKTVGIAGASAVIYDAYSVGKANSKRFAEKNNADYFEKIHSTKRLLSNESAIRSSVQNKVADLRYKNPIVPVYGKVKGFLAGMFNSLGDNLVPVSLISLTLATKGTFSKIGAIGVAACGVMHLLRDGFGLGNNTMKQ